MKNKIKLNGKLSFNKETIAKLNDDQMNSIEGGSGQGCSGQFCQTNLWNICMPKETEICAISDDHNCESVNFCSMNC